MEGSKNDTSVEMNVSRLEGSRSDDSVKINKIVFSDVLLFTLQHTMTSHNIFIEDNNYCMCNTCTQ